MVKKFIITDNEEEVQSWLDLGYEIEKMEALHIATGASGSYSRYDGRIAVYLSKKENDEKN
jgi:hypothetical protein